MSLELTKKIVKALDDKLARDIEVINIGYHIVPLNSLSDEKKISLEKSRNKGDNMVFNGTALTR